MTRLRLQVKGGPVVNGDALKNPVGVLDVVHDRDNAVEFSSGGVLYLTRESLQFQRLQTQQLAFHLDYVLAQHGSLTDDLAEVCASPGFAREKVNLPYIPAECRGRLRG